MKLGVVGVGIVGNAFYEGMKHAFEVVRYDTRPESSDVDSLVELLQIVDGPIFICVPTPMNPDGSASTAIIENLLSNIYGWGERIVVIKSTVPPGTTERLNNKFGPTISVAFNPEFLTEANPVEDFKKQEFIIVGGNPEVSQVIANIYSVAYPQVLQVQCNATTAEMVKYVENCFLATKVSFANEIYQICNKLDISYDGVIKIAKLDKRLGESHWKVPGPMPASDGSGKLLAGYSGSCFPKDVNALIAVAIKLGVDPKVLRAGWEKNLEVRPEKDWEQMKGRAVV
jgi:UDPglucose 6-dehydrogenase